MLSGNTQNIISITRSSFNLTEDEVDISVTSSTYRKQQATKIECDIKEGRVTVKSFE